jgi:hypothetical protein
MKSATVTPLTGNYAHFRSANVFSRAFYASCLDAAMRVVSLAPCQLNHLLQLWYGVLILWKHHLDIPIAAEMIPLSVQLVDLSGLLVA